GSRYSDRDGKGSVGGPRRRRTAILLAAAVAGCSGEDGSVAAASSANGSSGGDAGTCLDGACTDVGVPADGCATGFEHDDAHGCRPILPATDCGSGTLALPGETACHDVAPCGQGRWGSIPVDATTQYVDASYAASDSDGTSERPWRTISAGITA